MPASPSQQKSTPAEPPRIEEIAGLYGPVNVPEHLIQTLWQRQDFDPSNLQTSDAQPVRVIHPGTRNHLEGPDFRQARLEISGIPVTGDIEIHFRARDWIYHKHNEDIHYNQVVLHVLLFPPTPDEPPCFTATGKPIPQISLLTRLYDDLEAYAEEDAIARALDYDLIDQQPPGIRGDPAALRSRLTSLAVERWQRKTRVARSEIEELGAEEALHRATLMILGQKRNRTPMIAIAREYPLKRFQNDLPAAQSLYETQADSWNRVGIRPANQPLVRLRSYCALIAANPQFVREALQLITPIPSRFEAHATTPTSRYRRQIHLPAALKKLQKEILHDCIGGTRVHTWIGDALLPIAFARDPDHGFPLWFHAYPGDTPDALARFLRHTRACDRDHPLTFGRLQGALQLFLNNHPG